LAPFLKELAGRDRSEPGAHRSHPGFVGERFEVPVGTFGEKMRIAVKVVLCQITPYKSGDCRKRIRIFERCV